jgi:hypothetical protein
MDFKSLLTKLDGMEARTVIPAAPVLPKSVQLNEDAQLRVLSGRTSYVAEAKKKEDEEFKEDQSSLKKTGDSFTTHRGGKATKTSTGISVRHDTDDSDYVPPKITKNSKASKTSAEKAGDRALDKKQAQDSKAAEKKNPGSVKRYQDGKLVEPGKKKESIGEASEAQKAARAKFMSMVKGKKEKKGNKEEVEEGAKPDFLDVDKDGDKKEPMKKAVADKKKGAAPKKGVNPFAKKTVKESVEQRLSFKQMVHMVQESGGQQQIDAVDKALFTWAERVAKAKLGEGMKAEVFAGLIYERNGGTFEMYDVLSEDQK